MNSSVKKKKIMIHPLYTIIRYIKILFFTVNHQHSSRGNYRGINNNIGGQNKIKHNLHSNGSHNNSTSHSPNSRPHTLKRKKQCVTHTQRGPGDCVR